jgi:hypothetical protein
MHALAARVQQQERAGAVRVLGEPRASTQPCPNSAACWSPAMPATGTDAPKRVRPSSRRRSPRAAAPRAAATRAPRTASSSSSSQSRCRCCRAACATRSSDPSRARAARQLPDEPRVDGAGGEFAALRALRAVPARCAAATPAWCPRSTDRARGRCARAPTLPAPAPSAPGSAPPCAGPARRWRGAPVRRCAVPDHDGLALVRDAAPASSSCGCAFERAASEGLRATRCVTFPDLAASCSTQPGRG